MEQANNSGLHFNSIVKTFGGTHALNNVSFKVNKGEIVALLGENGAGKSTLIKILAGLYNADGGQITINGQDHASASQSKTKRSIAFIHQDLGLIEWMSIAENMALSLGYPKKFGLINWDLANERARHALAQVGCNFDPSIRISQLSRTEKSLIAIARALASDCEFLVLDEPTASLPTNEVDRLFAALNMLKSKGVGMIYVSHRLDEIFSIADRVVVLRDGNLIGQQDIKTAHSGELVSMIVGKEMQHVKRPPEVSTTNLILTVNQLTTGNIGPVDFDLRQGEIVGLVGLRGAGHEEIGRCLFGAQPHHGLVKLNDMVIDLSTPRRAMQVGMGMIARDRVLESISSALTVRENLFINPQATGRQALSVRSAQAESMEAQAIGARLGLSPNDPSMTIEALSGGNQQKVVIGRWLETDRKVLIAEDPTAGVDVGAKADIYRLIYQAVARGMSVVIVSTDFEEVSAICHRALVFNRGQLVRELTGKQLSIESIMQVASAGELDVEVMHKERIYAVS